MANGETYYLLEKINYQQPFNGKCLSFSCGNLQMQNLIPMRRWRINFCGSLKKISNNKEIPEKKVFVKFVFIWSAISDIHDSFSYDNSKKLAACISATDWNALLFPPVKNFYEILNFYCQMGNLRGSICVEEDNEYEMYLFGKKIRNLGNFTNITECDFQVILGYVPETGFGMHLSTVSISKFFKNLPFGFVIEPSGDLYPLKELNITSKPSNRAGENDFQANLQTVGNYEILGKLSGEKVELSSNEEKLDASFIKFSINNRYGYGFILSGKIVDSPLKSKEIESRLSFPKVIPLTVKFTDEISQLIEISGGKGSSLGKLTKLSNSNKTFVVPKGILITTESYKAFLNDEILKTIKNLEHILYGKNPGDLKEACDLAAAHILNTVLPDNICHCIIDDLKYVFGNGFCDRKFAVRSSSTGEDTDTMSAAGQMDTLLGVQGLQEIFVAIKKCWASQFSHIAITYKRQIGQALNSPMAVVVQEMVVCDVSGVLFTCNPVNNDPDFITITANYGLGETVVSGSVEPDTVLLQRDEKHSLEIKSVNVGSKHQKIIMKDSGGTVNEELPEESKSKVCISTDMAITLSKLAIKVENFYRSPIDIEWGILDGKIFLFQSRPVTTKFATTDFEIKHEHDSVVRSERDYFTVANVGEVMPGAVSPLGMDLVRKIFTTSIAREAVRQGGVDVFSKSRYYESLMHSFYHQMVMSAPELTCRYGHGTLFSKGFGISVFGRIVDEPELYEVAKEKMPYDPPNTLRSNLNFIKDLFFYDKDLNRIKKEVTDYKIKSLNCKTADEAFEVLMKSCCTDCLDAAFTHLNTSGQSSNWNIIIFLILVKSKGRFDTDVYSDLGKILATSTNLESADIPSSLQNLANQLAKDLGGDNFKSMDLEEATKWLNTADTEAGQKYRQFIKKHGHRCLKESDVYSTTWGQDPRNLIKLLQNLTGNAKEVTEKQVDDYTKIFSELRVPLNIVNKTLLRFAIPFCRKGVQSRETTKSIIVKYMDYWRKGFQHLAKLMVLEGRIPDKDMIFFMTLHELSILIKTRDPKIISRANHRRKLFPVLNQYKFPELMKGFPKPINEEDDDADTMEYVGDLIMYGTPVSQGIVKGYARVATSLEQAEQLQAGEILIAYSTDIGWSPYFPIISGVVTELGGLISHGAVVSREYGLPCVVGLQGATKKFKTGDFVLLDGKKGILQRLPLPSQD